MADEIISSYIKTSVSELTVEKVIPEKVISSKYDYAFLVQQKEAILSQITARQAELAEVEMLLKECAGLQIGQEVILEPVAKEPISEVITK